MKNYAWGLNSVMSKLASNKGIEEAIDPFFLVKSL